MASSQVKLESTLPDPPPPLAAVLQQLRDGLVGKGMAGAVADNYVALLDADGFDTAVTLAAVTRRQLATTGISKAGHQVCICAVVKELFPAEKPSKPTATATPKSPGCPQTYPPSTTDSEAAGTQAAATSSGATRASTGCKAGGGKMLTRPEINRQQAYVRKLMSFAKRVQQGDVTVPLNPTRVYTPVDMVACCGIMATRLPPAFLPTVLRVAATTPGLSLVRCDRRGAAVRGLVGSQAGQWWAIMLRYCEDTLDTAP